MLLVEMRNRAWGGGGGGAVMRRVRVVGPLSSLIPDCLWLHCRYHDLGSACKCAQVGSTTTTTSILLLTVYIACGTSVKQRGVAGWTAAAADRRVRRRQAPACAAAKALCPHCPGHPSALHSRRTDPWV
jgi:hypothetical protein